MKTYKVNPTPFKNITDKMYAYILGLIWADGYVIPPYIVGLSTTYPDAEFFVPLFLKTGKWKYYDEQKRDNWKKSCQIKTSNRELVSFLVENDYTSKHYASADKILSHIPENLLRYWLRGFFDGDGHLYTDNKGSHRVSFSGPHDQEWDHLQLLCEKIGVNGIIHKEVRNTGSGSTFTIYGMYKSIKFCEYMYNGYPDDNLGLQRKYKKLTQLKTTEEKNRFKGICEYKSGPLKGKWRAYTSGANGIPPKHLGIFTNKENAMRSVEKFYYSHPKTFLQ